MKSTEFLQSAIDVQAERGKQYDKPTGERSMGATISAFNCITGYTLEESDGWMLLSLLKLVRQSQNPEQYHHDSALDFVAYASLYAEAASEQCGQKETAEEAFVEFDFSGPVMDFSESAVSSWDEKLEAPDWAMWLAHDEMGSCWFENMPDISNGIYHNKNGDIEGNVSTVSGSPEGQHPSLQSRPQ